MPIFMLSLLAGDIWLWQHKKINYAFIFDFDARDHLNFAQVAEVCVVDDVELVIFFIFFVFFFPKC